VIGHAGELEVAVPEFDNEITYIGVFLGSLYDRTGSPLPAIVGGYTAASGGSNLAVVILLSALAGVLGEIVFYLAGRGGRRIASRFVNEDRQRGTMLTRIRRLLFVDSIARPEVLIFGRFLPIVGRAVAPLAGTLRVPARRFAVCAVLGELLLMTVYSCLAFAIARIVNRGSLNMTDGAIALTLWLAPKCLAVVLYALLARAPVRRRRSAR
jgi:membrane protein DedA with SNARE-associated domain